MTEDKAAYLVIESGTPPIDVSVPQRSKEDRPPPPRRGGRKSGDKPAPDATKPTRPPRNPRPDKPKTPAADEAQSELVGQLAEAYKGIHTGIALARQDERWIISDSEAVSVARPAVEFADSRGWLDHVDSAPLVRLGIAAGRVEIPRILGPLIARIIAIFVRRSTATPSPISENVAAALNSLDPSGQVDRELWERLTPAEQELVVELVRAHQAAPA